VDLESLTLDPWASRRWQELLKMLDQFDASLKDLDNAVAGSSILAGDLLPQNRTRLSMISDCGEGARCVEVKLDSARSSQ
jgi:hypothetical protein